MVEMRAQALLGRSPASLGASLAWKRQSVCSACRCSQRMQRGISLDCSNLASCITLGTLIHVKRQQRSRSSCRVRSDRIRRLAKPSDVLEKGASASSVLTNDLETSEERWLMIFLVAAAYVVWTMCKVNMSIAILPMAQQYGWDPSEVGLIQSSLYWGYAVSQIPGGFLATRYGGKRVLLGAAIVWSVMTVVAPWAASVSTQSLIASRVIVGLGEGMAPPTGARVISTWIPEKERSRAVSILGIGSKSGNVVALFLAPQVIAALGWPAVFYSFGGAGLVWATVWAAYGRDREPCGPEACTVELPASAEEEDIPIPWNRILTSPPVWGIVVAHFCNNWGMFGLLTWLPTYLNKELGFDLQGSALVTIVPSVFGIACAAFAGGMADTLRSNGWELTSVRKLGQASAFIIPGVCLGLLSTIRTDEYSAILPIVLLVAAVGSSSFSYAGIYSSHIDLNAKYAGLVNGISTTCGAVAATLSNMYCGSTLAATSSFAQALFIPSVIFYLLGLITYLALYDAKPQDWDSDA